MSSVRPRFSIVIPCYNEAAYIDKTLHSLRNQNFQETFEIIVVDNNCTDRTVEISKSYGARIIHENQRGVCWARQAGTKAAHGDFIISTDADTVLPCNWLSEISKSFKQNRDIVAVAGPCSYIDGPWWGTVYPKILFGAVSFIYRVSGRPFYVTATNIAFKKSAWQGYNTTLTQGGDELDLLHQLAKKGRVAFNNYNPSFTSGRRLKQGLFYNFFVSFLIYYLLAYYVNKIFKKTLLGNAPIFRESQKRPTKKSLYPRYAYISVILASVFLVRTSLLTNLEHFTYNIFAAVGDILQDIV